MANHRVKMISGLVLCGLFLILGLFFFFFVTAYRFSGILFMLLAALIGCYTALSLLGVNHMVLAKTLRLILTSLLIIGVFLAIVTGIKITMFEKHQPQTACRFVIVLGAGVDGDTPSLSLQERINTAYTYLYSHPNTIAVLSGGKGDGERISEAACMYRELTARGIDPRQLRQEDQAVNTSENIRFSLDLLEEEFGQRPDRIGLISSDYHLYRACSMAQKQADSVVGIPARSSIPTLKFNYFLREIAAVWYYSLIGG